MSEDECVLPFSLLPMRLPAGSLPCFVSSSSLPRARRRIAAWRTSTSAFLADYTRTHSRTLAPHMPELIEVALCSLLMFVFDLLFAVW